MSKPGFAEAFEALVIAVDALRAESLSGTNGFPPAGLIKQINNILDTVNASGELAIHLDGLSVGVSWTAALRQVSVALEIAGKRYDKEVYVEAASPYEQVAPVPSGKAKPKLFIGCSVEGLQVAKIIQLQLRYSVDSNIWHQGVFGLSSGTLETLVATCRNFEFALLVLTPDDLLIKRGETHNAARDNVLFELGLFIGALGREKVFMAVDTEVKLPSDLAGIKPATFAGGGAMMDLQGRIGPVVTELEIAMSVL